MIMARPPAAMISGHSRPRGRAMTSSQITAAPIMNSNARQGIQ